MTQTELTPSASLTGKWKSYPAYKDSGVEWLGVIPEHWEVTAIKKLAQPGYRTFTDGDWIEAPYITQEGIRLLQTGNVGIGKFKEQGFRYISEETFKTLGCTEVLPGDVLICRLADPVGRACIAPEIGVRMITSVDVCILKVNDSIDSHFVIYFLSSPQYLNWMQALCRGGTRDRVSRSMLGAIEFPIPTFHEQHSIATFLDHETARINTLVAKKERLIELLQEKRAALISHAVTKGLDPTVPMKDSGVEWLGEIPAHWEVKRLKFCLDSIEQGWSPPCENRPAELEEWGVLKVGCVNGVKFNPDENKALPAEIQPIPELEIKQGDVLVSRANTRELLGSASVVSQVRPHLLLCDKLYRLKILSNTVDLVYLVLAMGSGIIRFQLERDATGASNSMQNISQGTILNLVIPLPDIYEQHMITDYLDYETAKIDALISRISRGIEKLKEYSTALISAAVTGKIDVRDINIDDNILL